MSAAPKSSHEESGPSSSKYPHEDSGPYPKFSSSVSTEHCPPYEIGQENRIVKFSRIESHDMDRRSPLHTMYRMNSSSNDLHVDHPVVSENRLESKDSKDSRDYRFNNRDSKTETREVQGEARRDSQHVKSDKDVRYEGRGDDTKEIKHDRGSYNDMKSKVNMDVDVYGSSGHFNWKESKEYHRGKRYSDIPPGNADPWISCSNSQVHSETIKEGATTEEKDHAKGHEAIGKNKFDSKGEDKFKDKDRKRKDVKHPDWGERDKGRSDHQSSMHVANSSSGHKELGKEERDVERWERKDPAKDKGRLKEREKDHTKRDMWNEVDKESSHNEKDLGDGSNIMLEQENIESVKQQKEADSWKCAEKELRGRRKERDIDVDGDRLEKRNRAYDTASDDGCADEGGTEREHEEYNYGVQQHKRMQQSRGSPQVAYCEPCFRTRQEIEGSQGKAELSSVVYKVGECMQELINLWKEYEVSQAEKNGDVSHNSPILEIRIPAEYVTATNRQVRSGLLWGTDIYTDDSDIVAVLMHTGYCRPKTSPPPAIQELCATIRVLPPQDCYISTLRNNVRSRAWGAAIGCSYLVEQCCIIKKGGGTIDLEPCLTHTSTVEPTLAPVAVERTMTTRSAASNALRQQRFVREVTIQYNLCSEPWIKYSISIVADKGLKKPLYTSARLKKGEVLYLETHTHRYELCFTGERVIKNSQASHVHEGESGKSQNHHTHYSNGERNDPDNTIVIDIFRWSRCRKPFPQKVMHSIGIPLPLEYVEVLEDDLDWEDIQWSQTGVWIAGKEYTLARVHFLSMK